MRSVYLNLYQEDQVDFIMRTLEHLDFLNGLKVERDILYDEEDDSEQSSPEQLPPKAESPEQNQNPYHRRQGSSANPATQIYTIHSES